MPTTLAEAVNRGFNLMTCGVLGLAGLAFGTVLIEEKDLPDKVDDAGFLALGIIAVAWYLIGRNRFKRSVVPLVMAGVVVLVQAVGIVLEHDDSNAFGDNIGGSWLVVPFFILTAVQWYRTRPQAGE